MDKYDIALDIIENHEKYPAERLSELLSDPETREIYDLMCKVGTAIDTNASTDANAEWIAFTRKHSIPHRRMFMWSGSRAASIVLLALTSLAAVAVGITVTVAISDKRAQSSSVEETRQLANESSATEDTSAIANDTVTASPSPIMFEDETLESIMRAVAANYGVTVRFNNDDAASLHLYYKLDPTLSIDEIISQLDTFEQIDISRDGDTLTID